LIGRDCKITGQAFENATKYTANLEFFTAMFLKTARTTNSNPRCRADNIVRPLQGRLAAACTIAEAGLSAQAEANPIMISHHQKQRWGASSKE
jgi:hypothetical protein